MLARRICLFPNGLGFNTINELKVYAAVSCGERYSIFTVGSPRRVYHEDLLELNSQSVNVRKC